jgi:hypothetical protein
LLRSVFETVSDRFAPCHCCPKPLFSCRGSISVVSTYTLQLPFCHTAPRCSSIQKRDLKSECQFVWWCAVNPLVFLSALSNLHKEDWDFMSKHRVSGREEFLGAIDNLKFAPSNAVQIFLMCSILQTSVSATRMPAHSFWFPCSVLEWVHCFAQCKKIHMPTRIFN